jgi:hypothetical protein
LVWFQPLRWITISSCSTAQPNLTTGPRWFHQETCAVHCRPALKSLLKRGGQQQQRDTSNLLHLLPHSHRSCSSGMPSTDRPYSALQLPAPPCCSAAACAACCCRLRCHSSLGEISTVSTAKRWWYNDSACHDERWTCASW